MLCSIYCFFSLSENRLLIYWKPLSDKITGKARQNSMADIFFSRRPKYPPPFFASLLSRKNAAINEYRSK